MVPHKLPQGVKTSEGLVTSEVFDGLRLVKAVDSLESPSLAATEGPVVPAYELKFLLPELLARAIEAQARRQLIPDSHGDPAAGNSYHTTSLYCDTARFDVFHRGAGFKRRKHRLRRYGQEHWLFLERKSKWGDRVKKLRTKITETELPLLAGAQIAADWPGYWFHQHLRERGLAPVCRIAYERVALVGHSAAGPVRLTFDRRIRGVLTNKWDLAPLDEGLPILSDHVICEFKYPGFLPVLFKEIIGGLRLTPMPVSKYRSFLRACGISSVS